MCAPSPNPFSSGNTADTTRPEDLSARILPEISQLLAVNNSDLSQTLPEISQQLQLAVQHSWLGIAVRDDARSALRMLGQHSPDGIAPLPADFSLPLAGTPAEAAFRTRKPVLIQRIARDDFPCEVTTRMLDAGPHSSCWVPLLHGATVLGAFWVGARQKAAFGSTEAETLTRMADQLALAVAHQLATLQLARLQKRVTQEISDYHSPSSPANFLAQALWDTDGRVLDANDAYLDLVGSRRDELSRGLLFWNDMGPAEYSELDRCAVEEINATGRCTPFEKEIWRGDGGRIPVLVQAAALDDARSCVIAYLVDLRGRSRRPAHRIISGQQNNHPASFIVADGRTRELQQQVEKVAPTTATVLIQGETGTGKEMFAQMIHQMSQRFNQPFIKVNCAAIPAGLLESELFGHEKGAFTGAAGRKIGRIELAHGGTLFLDEIGDLPLELLPKLLRVLQEQQFERLGGTKTHEVDIRLIAATNLDLASMVKEGRFRSDLFYRLNVLPLTVPPLRDRKESIPVLVEHFVRKFSEKFGRSLKGIPPEAMQLLQRWHWPGNVRELENLIERAMILAPGEELDISPDDFQRETQSSVLPTTLRDVEREHILRVFRECGGVIGGRKGTAARLAVKRTTLQYKMKKLQITRADL
jgi:transcriptional regulator with GAF, ATPase, and Fis domain